MGAPNKAGMSFSFIGIVLATLLPIKDSRMRRVDWGRQVVLAFWTERPV